MILDIVLFVVGIVLIVFGANFLTDGASVLARRFGVSPLMVGLTIVAFGTSAPELVVSLTAALNGNADIATGNVVGSNIFNVLMIGGLTAIIAPLTITRSTIIREIPLMLLASLVLSVMALDTIFSGLGAGEVTNYISRSEGLVLLGFFFIFLFYTFSIAKVSGADEDSSAQPTPSKPLYLLILFIVGGLTALVYGGDLFVKHASAIARGFGVSDSLIGLTIVAMGTSMPELATSITAALKKETEIAVGNIVGSGIFNIFFILGATASIKPIEIEGLTIVDFGVLCLSALMMYIFGVFFGKRTITRVEGAIMVLSFVVYTAYLIYNV